MGVMSALKWLIGFLIAFLIIWPLSLLYVDSIPLYVKAEGGNFFHRMPGSSVRQYREGFARTNIGQYGLIGVGKINHDQTQKILIWGDSFVEAFNVPDEKKMSFVLSKMAQRTFKDSITGVSIGRSGNSIADYYYQIPYYESRLTPIMAHFFIIGHIEDTLPDQQSAHGAKFVSMPTYAIYPENQERYHYDVYRKFLSRLKLDFLWYSARDCQAKKWKWLPSVEKDNQNKLSSSTEKKEDDMMKAWTYLFDQLKKQTDKPIVMVLLSDLPYLKKHQIVLSEDDNYIREKFKHACSVNNIGLIDMQQSFVSYYQSTGRFPRGFINSHPWEGHLNEDGHALVASGIFKYLKDHKIAIH